MSKKKLMLAVLSAGGVSAAFAEDVVSNTVVIPGGIDIPGMIQSGVTVLGGIVAVAIAAWAGWVLVKKCLQWIRKAF